MNKDGFWYNFIKFINVFCVIAAVIILLPWSLIWFIAYILAVINYVDCIWELHNMDMDSDESDLVRERADPYWRAMTEEEKDKVSGWSEWLYHLEETGKSGFNAKPIENKYDYNKQKNSEWFDYYYTKGLVKQCR